MSNTPRELQCASQNRPWLFYALLAGLLAAGAGPAAAGSIRACDPLSFEQVRDSTIGPLMAAVMTGSTASIGDYLSEKMAARYQVLLTENETYPDYLRSYFKDAAHQLRDVIATETGYTAIIDVYWADGSHEAFDLELGDSNPHLPTVGSLTDCQDSAL